MKRTTRNKYTTVIFDFDGTLVDTNEVVYQSWQHTYRQLRGCEGDEETILNTFGEPVAVSAAKLFPDYAVEEVLNVYRSYQYDYFEKTVKLFPGMKELLVTLKQKGYKTGLTTSRLRNTTYKGLKKFELEQYFDAIVTADECKRHKPDPEPVLMTLERIGSDPQESIMVGDSRYDMLCAVNAGIDYVQVAWAQALDLSGEAEGVEPDITIESAADLLTVLESSQPREESTVIGTR